MVHPASRSALNAGKIASHMVAGPFVTSHDVLLLYRARFEKYSPDGFASDVVSLQPAAGSGLHVQLIDLLEITPKQR